MEGLNTTGQMLNRTEFSGTISGAELKRDFCRRVIEWAKVANLRGLALGVQFSQELPDYFYGDQEIFPEVVDGLLEFSINNTTDGLVRITVIPSFRNSSTDWWLTVMVDDSSDGLCSGLIRYIEGEQKEPEKDGHDCRSVSRIRRVREGCRHCGGEMEIVNIVGDKAVSNKYGWGNRYLARIPYRRIDAPQLAFNRKYLL